MIGNWLLSIQRIGRNVLGIRRFMWEEGNKDGGREACLWIERIELPR